jgi:hypothetical protein
LFYASAGTNRVFFATCYKQHLKKTFYKFLALSVDTAGFNHRFCGKPLSELVLAGGWGGGDALYLSNQSFRLPTTFFLLVKRL